LCGRGCCGRHGVAFSSREGEGQCTSVHPPVPLPEGRLRTHRPVS
jgi:hypothetical protein